MTMQEQFEIHNGVLVTYKDAAPEVTVPEGVHTIADGAFKGMAWLLKVSLPSSLQKIGAEAFKGCRQLAEINFPEGLTEIGEFAFHRCHKLTELIFPKTLTKVEGYAFLYCDGLKKVVMEGPESLGRGCFSHNLSLEDVTLNKNVDASNFGEEVFEGCVRLHRITLSGQVYEIDNLIEAMSSHSSYPETIKAIARGVFHALQIEDGVLKEFHINLKSISLPEGITTIGKSCFFDKKGIWNITLPKSLREIRANAFLNCINLEEITLQSEDITLDEKAFRGCNHLKTVHLLGETYDLENETENTLISQIRDQILSDFYVSGKVLVRYLGEEEQIEIPKEVEIIGERCFYGKERLKIVTCPEGLLEIREQAFAGCLTLQTVALSDKLKRIEREAFAECKKLLKINLPESLTYIGEYAFRRCFTLPVFSPWPEKASIDPYAFYRAKQFERLEGAQRLPRTVEAEPAAALEGECIAPYAFTRNAEIKTLRLQDVKRIGKYAYSACPNLEEIVIDAPECVIERNAFSNCPKLRKVILHVKELGKAAFSYDRALSEVTLSGVDALPEECFTGCHGLLGFTARDLTQMGARCFDECTGLRTFDFTGIAWIGERAFERCDVLESIVLNGVECGYHAFADCAGLKSVTISKDTVLKSGALIGCTQVRSIVFEGKSYEFSKFADSLNHVGNPYPLPVREAIASIYACFDVRDKKVLLGYSQDATEVTIPGDVEELGQDLFRDHVRLREIHISESVRLFGSHAFSQTKWLEEQRKASEMVMVNGVLLDGALCKGAVTLPESARRVASWCFAGNIDITELVIPSERIGIESLSFRNCLNLKKITDWDGNVYELKSVEDLRTKGYPELIQRIFTECINCFKLDAEDNLIESTGNITKLNFPEGIKSIGDGVYKDCHLLETICLSKDTKQIGKSAFENSKWLKNVQGAEAVESLGALAFSGCQSLESIDLSDALLEMGSRCFEHCGSLTEIKLSENLERIPERAFFRCKALQKVTIPKSVKQVEKEAFAFCEALTDVYVSEDTALAENAFAYCAQVQIHRVGEAL